jgi:hypothetical protein
MGFDIHYGKVKKNQNYGQERTYLKITTSLPKKVKLVT